MSQGASSISSHDDTRHDALQASGALLRLDDICKEFPGVKALSDVRFDLRSGEVHAVCGENGAGKSTLMKIISGVYQPTSGTILHKGQKVQYASPLESEAAGIAIIHQELNLVPHLSVAENIYLAREPRKGFLVDRKNCVPMPNAVSIASASISIRIRWCADFPLRSARWWKSPRRFRSMPKC